MLLQQFFDDPIIVNLGYVGTAVIQSPEDVDLEQEVPECAETF
jgi:hypothetical protein